MPFSLFEYKSDYKKIIYFFFSSKEIDDHAIQIINHLTKIINSLQRLSLDFS